MLEPIVHYRHPPRVRPAGDCRPLLSTPEGGFVALDDPLMALWKAADGRSIEQVEAAGPWPRTVSKILPEALACLAEAGLLGRTPDVLQPTPAARPTNGSASVTAVIVVSVPAELEWLERCLAALQAQHHPLDEIVVVDNAVGRSLDALTDVPGMPVRVHSLRSRTTYAAALNAGVSATRGDYLLLLNADAWPDPGAVGNLVARALESPGCAAIAPKLKFWRAPAFLNGIGNRVPGWGWGTDNGIGQLDLGQLDDWTDVPSACFSAVLVARSAWRDVGPFDARYPAYYEDADWAFRARLLGYRIVAAPDAHVLHAFGASWSAGGSSGLSPGKLRNALVGRFRFTAKIPGPRRALLLLSRCAREWKVDITGALRQRDRAILRAFAGAAPRALWSIPQVLWARRGVQSRRRVRDAALFHRCDDLTPSMVWRDLPELTTANIASYYAPLIRQGRTRPLPEVTPERLSAGRAPTSVPPS